MVETEMIEYRLNGPVSQERQRIRVMAALRECRFPQAILIDGPGGIGKKALAMEIAKALQCTDPNMRPCGKCFGCKIAMDPGATDNWVVPMESKEAHARSAEDVSSGSVAKTVQDFKRAYIEEVIKNPYRIDVFGAGAEISVELIRSMNDSAANALLKTLEEVPPDTYFILTTSSRERLLQTIRSRCLALHLLPLTDAEVRSETERVLGDEEEADVSDDVVGLAVGSPGKALYYMNRAAGWCDLASEFVIRSLRNEYSEIFARLAEASLEDVSEANRFLEVLSFLLSDLLRKQSGAPLRLASTTNRIDMDAFPRVDANALELSLAAVQETMSRIASRRTPSMVCLQSLSIKLFEGFK